MERDQDRRATWLETRNLEENFKQLVYLSMQEVYTSTLTTTAAKLLVRPVVTLLRRRIGEGEGRPIQQS